MRISDWSSDVCSSDLVVAVARQVHERRIEAPVAVAAQEQLAAHALLQAKDARGQLQQLVLAGLEQLVAGQRLEDVLERLATVAVRLEAGLAHHVLEALAHQRDVPRAPVVGAGGVQAEEALLAGRLALVVELEHADVVHVAGVVRSSGLGWNCASLGGGVGMVLVRLPLWLFGMRPDSRIAGSKRSRTRGMSHGRRW